MIELRDYAAGDMWLTAALECDPNIMRDLGGPTPREKIQSIHERRLAGVLAKSHWCLTIVPSPEDGPAGTIGIWESEWQGTRIHETGWMLLPAFQGRGLVKEAGRLLLARARQSEKFEQIHAFPGIQNGASNAICRKLGFEFAGEVKIAYNGPPQPSNHWKIDLRV